MTTQHSPEGKSPNAEPLLASEPIEQASYTLLVKTAARLEAELNRALRGMDLTSATFNILRILESAGQNGQSCGDISEQLIAEVPDMTRLLDRLERLGYIVRERSSVDRRMVRVTISEKGRTSLESLRESVRDCHVRQLGHLGQAKLLELNSLLKVILSHASTQPRASQSREVGPAKHAPH
jgi:DNA-binding MarR family transcriptional regulator